MEHGAVTRGSFLRLASELNQEGKPTMVPSINASGHKILLSYPPASPPATKTKACCQAPPTPKMAMETLLLAAILILAPSCKESMIPIEYEVLCATMSAVFQSTTEVAFCCHILAPPTANAGLRS
jgi:hypothetical protein